MKTGSNQDAGIQVPAASPRLSATVRRHLRDGFAKPGARLALAVSGVAALLVAVLIVVAFLVSAFLRPAPERVDIVPSAVIGAIEGIDRVPSDDRAIGIVLGERMRDSRIAVATLVAIRLEETIQAMRVRLEADFLPHYLAFPRRKLQELKAYNTFALDWVHNAWTGDGRDRSTPALVANFEEAFLNRVVMPGDVRLVLGAIGDEAARVYLVEIAAGLEEMRTRRGISPADWREELAALPPISFIDREGRTVTVALGELGDAMESLNRALGASIANDLQIRFERTAIIEDPGSVTVPSGESLFSVGRNAAFYYASFVVYWIVLLIVLQSGLIPINFFGALLGWVVWEILSWSSWILYEWVQFGQAREVLDPVIRAFAEEYFNRLRTLASGSAFNVLHAFEWLYEAR